METAPSTPVQPQTTRRSTSDAAPFEDAGSWNEGRTDLRLSVPCATGKGSTAAGPVPAQLQNRIALAASAFANSLPSAFAPELRESGLLVSSWQADRMVWVDLLPAWKGPPWIDSPKGWSLSFLLTTSHLSHIYLNEVTAVLQERPRNSRRPVSLNFDAPTRRPGPWCWPGNVRPPSPQLPESQVFKNVCGNRRLRSRITRAKVRDR